MNVEQLEAWCLSNDMGWHPQAGERFERYIELLLHYQKQTNLTGFKTGDDIVEALFTDSLQILRTCKNVGSLVDVGTGAGFPSIPIKILHPETAMHLVEPRTKRYAFLQVVVRELGLQAMRISAKKIEQIAVEPVDLIVSKAFAPLPEWLEISRPWAEQGARVGCFVSLADWEAMPPGSDAVYHVSSVESHGRVYACLTLKKESSIKG